MGSVTIVYRQYEGYVGYKVSPPGSKKVTLLGVGKDGPACLRQIEAAIALINEAQEITTTEPPALRALSGPEENDHGETRSENGIRQGTKGSGNLLRQGQGRQGEEAVSESEEVGQGQK